MNKKMLLLGIVVAFFLLTPVGMEGASSAELNVDAVYIVPIEGAIEPGLSEFIRRVLADASTNNGAVVFEINTFGGRVDAATEIRDQIVRLQVPVIAFVTDRAWSAGALITLAAPQIAMTPYSSMGSAEPRPLEEKTVSALRAEFEAAAERSGRDGRIAAAMVDADVEIEGLVDAGKILTLSAFQAEEQGFADVIVNSREELLAHYGLDGIPVTVAQPNWAERLARAVTEPTLSSFLLSLGFLGLIFEFTSPGWGVPGTAGIVALTLFFGGRLIAGVAGFEIVILFLVGLALIFVELFATPGFGVPGGLGALALLASIVLSFETWQGAVLGLSLTLLFIAMFFVFFGRRIGQSKAWKKLVLSAREDKELGYKGTPTYVDLVGKQGVALSPLRPSGTIRSNDQLYDVVSEGGFIEKEATVEIVKIEGTRVVVREITK